MYSRFVLPCRRPAHFPPMNNNSDDICLEAIEGILDFLHKGKNIDELMQEIRFRFVTGSNVFSAGYHTWIQLGLKPREALFLSKLMDISRYEERTSYSQHTQMSTLLDCWEYLTSNFRGMQVEYFYLFCINKQGRLKERVFLQEGTVDSTLFPIHKILSEVLRIKPDAILLAHNHPGGTLRPSQQDITCTMRLFKMLEALQIPLVDHVIVSNRTVVSMRLSGFIPEKQWLQQHSANRRLHHWLDGMDEDFCILSPETSSAE